MTKRMTQKYWNSLEEGSRYRALKKVLSHFSDGTLREYAKQKARDLYFVWSIIVREVKPTDDDFYRTQIGHTFLP